MELLFKKNNYAFVRCMREIEDEMLEAYGKEYGENAKSLYSAQALRLLLEIFMFVNQMNPFYRSTRKMLEQLSFIAETGECGYLGGITGNPNIALLMLNRMEEVQRKKAVQYAARWLEYRYRVYEKAKQPESNQRLVAEQMKKIDEMALRRFDASLYLAPGRTPASGKAWTAENADKPKRVENVPDVPDESDKLKYPLRLYEHLDSYVVGQDEVKKSIAMAVHHYVNYNIRNNVLMIGPSGSGKNYVTKILSQFKDLEKDMVVYVYDTSALTPNGFQGANVQDIFKGFDSLCKAKGKSNKKGIIYLDEIDKIIYPNTDSNNENMNAIVQRQLLAALEGTTVISGVDTSKILFILGGAFEGLYEMEKERMKKKQSKVGFLSVGEANGEISMEDCQLKEDLLALGAQKEFLARIPVLVRMERLGKEELKKILLHEKTGVIKQKQELFAKDGLELIVEEEVYDLLAEKMYQENMGARSARNIMENVVKNYNFDMLFHGYKKIIIHPGMITDNEKPRFEGGEENDSRPVRNVGPLHSRMDRVAV